MELRPASGRGALLVLLVCCLVAGGSGCIPGVDQTFPHVALTERSRELHAQRSLTHARRFREQGNLEAALRATDRGLYYQPENPRIHRLRAEILGELGREDAAAEERALAARFAPPSPLSSEPLVEALESSRVTVLVLPPPSSDDPARPWSDDRVPSEWPDAESVDAIRSRLAIRLPGAEVMVVGEDEYKRHAETIASVRKWLGERASRPAISLRLDRAFCGETTRDGPFAVTWLRVAVASGFAIPEPAEQSREILMDPVDCRGTAVARALERALALPHLSTAITRRDEEPAWSNREIRSLLPRLQVAIDREVESGRAALAAGQPAIAAAHLRRAIEIDPENTSATSLLGDIELSLSLSRELSELAETNRPTNGWRRLEDPEIFEVEPSEEEERRARQRIAEEERRRNDLLAAVTALEDFDAAPDPTILAALRPSEITDPGALGPRLARQRTRREIDRRILYGPDGTPLARYYFAVGSDAALLRETDQSGDGQPDHWVAYTKRQRAEVWQDDAGTGLPRVHMIYAKNGGPLERIEIDSLRKGSPDRIFDYNEGGVEREARDTTGDGSLDRVEHFDPEGTITMREEDLDGDGTVDVRTHYHAGRIKSREVLNPKLFESGPA